MSLHFLDLGQGLNSQKTVELLLKYSEPEFEDAINKYGEEFDEYVDNEQYTSLVISTLNIIDQTSTDKTLLQPLYSAIQYWITQASSKDQVKLIEAICNHIENMNDEDGGFKTRLYTTTFNALFTTQHSFPLFKKLLDISKKLNTISLLMTTILANLEQLIVQWKLTTQQISDILFALLDSIDQHNKQQIIQLTTFILRKCEPSTDLTIKAWVTLQNANPSLILLNQLANEHKFKGIEKSHLHQLFELIFEGNVQAAQQLVDSQSKYFNEINLVVVTALNQAKVSKLIKLADKQQVYTYEQISKELLIPKEQVEIWIISAIQSQNISAQIDQSKQEIYIVDNSNKVLEIADWKVLHNRLSQLQTKLKSAII